LTASDSTNLFDEFFRLAIIYLDTIISWIFFHRKMLTTLLSLAAETPALVERVAGRYAQAGIIPSIARAM